MSLSSVLAAFGRRTMTQIRDTALGVLKSGYQLAGLDIDTQEGGHAWFWWGVVAMFLESIQQQAAIDAAQGFPDTADGENLEHWGRVFGLVRKPDSDATLVLIVTGTPASIWIVNDTLTSADGIIYTALSGGTIPGGGATTGTFKATPTGGLATTGLGTRTNKTPLTVLTWTSPAPGIDPTATAQSISILGTDRETDAQFAQRLLAYIREKPAGFNRSEVRGILEAMTPVYEAYVYPCYQGVDSGDGIHSSIGTDETGGYVFAHVLAVPPNRILSAVQIAGLQAELNLLVPAGLPVANVKVLCPGETTQNIQVTLTNDATYPFPFNATYTVAGAGSTTTKIVCTADPALVAVGHLIAVKTQAVRGLFELRTVTAVDHGLFTIDVGTPFGGIPIAASTVYPAPANWQAATDAVLAVFDVLGPGSPPGPLSVRYPSPAERGSPTLYTSQLAAALVRHVDAAGNDAGVEGITAVTVTTPAADTTANENQLLMPGSIVFVQ